MIGLAPAAAYGSSQIVSQLDGHVNQYVSVFLSPQAVARQLLEAVAYMHELKLVHTDLKPENILLMDSEYVRLPPVSNSR